MLTVRTVAALRAALAPARRAGATIGLVPTMGSLHEGHASLVAAAAASCDETVVSLFVNPAQFDDPADLAAYPRDEARDARLAQAAGAGVLFAPPLEVVYPPGFVSEVRVGGPLTSTLEAAHRGAAHFHGVTTVVTKLLNMVGPDVAFFGQKDAQQALVIGRLVRDLDLPVRLEVLPTVREPDGLALSSRNVRLDAAARAQAPALAGALRTAAARAAAGERDGAALVGVGRAVLDAAGVVPEYLALVDPHTLAPVARLAGPALLAVAAPVGRVRLIDNVTVLPEP